jgi:hypothetical protein
MWGYAVLFMSKKSVKFFFAKTFTESYRTISEEYFIKKMYANSLEKSRDTNFLKIAKNIEKLRFYPFSYL